MYLKLKSDFEKSLRKKSLIQLVLVDFYYYFDFEL
jgi:predicted protein tyrosine phosphatase